MLFGVIEGFLELFRFLQGGFLALAFGLRGFCVGLYFIGPYKF